MGTTLRLRLELKLRPTTPLLMALLMISLMTTTQLPLMRRSLSQLMRMPRRRSRSLAQLLLLRRTSAVVFQRRRTLRRLRHVLMKMMMRSRWLAGCLLLHFTI